jgi:hypothetical protein
MMKSMDLTVGDALYLYTICSILPDSNDLLLYKESLFLWLCIEPPRHAWRCPAIQHSSAWTSHGVVLILLILIDFLASIPLL